MRFLLVLCVFSVFPLLSSARRVKLPSTKVRTDSTNKLPFLGQASQNQVSLQSPGLLKILLGKCGNNCIKQINQCLSPKDKSHLNGKVFSTQHTTFIGDVLVWLPSMKSRFLEVGITKEETNAFLSAIVTATTQSVKWSAAERNKILEFVGLLSKDNPNNHLEQIKNVKRACKLPKASGFAF